MPLPSCTARCASARPPSKGTAFDRHTLRARDDRRVASIAPPIGALPAPNLHRAVHATFGGDEIDLQAFLREIATLLREHPRRKCRQE
jgi:hypothetical protein